jgi:acyl carrier protein
MSIIESVLTDKSVSADLPNSVDAVAQLVRRVLTERSINTAVSVETDLRDAGLTSLDMVALVLSVEAEFDLTIPEAHITPANFRSISSINSLVTSLRG